MTTDVNVAAGRGVRIQATNGEWPRVHVLPTSDVFRIIESKVAQYQQQANFAKTQQAGENQYSQQ